MNILKLKLLSSACHQRGTFQLIGSCFCLHRVWFIPLGRSADEFCYLFYQQLSRRLALLLIKQLWTNNCYLRIWDCEYENDDTFWKILDKLRSSESKKWRNLWNFWLSLSQEHQTFEETIINLYTFQRSSEARLFLSACFWASVLTSAAQSLLLEMWAFFTLCLSPLSVRFFAESKKFSVDIDHYHFGYHFCRVQRRLFVQWNIARAQLFLHRNDA